VSVPELSIDQLVDKILFKTWSLWLIYVVLQIYFSLDLSIRLLLQFLFDLHWILHVLRVNIFAWLSLVATASMIEWSLILLNFFNRINLKRVDQCSLILVRHFPPELGEVRYFNVLSSSISFLSEQWWELVSFYRTQVDIVIIVITRTSWGWL
jgi:hypothetical protein